MSLSVLASGTLVRDPERRTSTAGRAYATALLRVPCEGEDAVLVSLIAFSSTSAEALLAHAKGDSLAVTGRAKLTSWAKDGEQRHGLSVTVEGVLSPYQLEKRRSRARGDAGGSSDGRADRAPSAELERVARAQASQGRAQVLTAPGAAGGIAAMADDVPFAPRGYRRAAYCE